jgi:tetratricopeptide (TPR) repeat protein
VRAVSEDRRARRLDRNALLAVLVFAVAAWAYAPSLRYGLLDWDDAEYVTANPVIALGVSRAALERAFEPHDGNWIPLTWLSLAADRAVFGDDPRVHHATNVLLHAATAALLLLVLARATGAVAPAAFVALAFALHPLRVESVAWVAERKDVLSGLFFVAALGAWVAYARRPGAIRYALAFVAALASLLSKPTAVTLPFVLGLLDFWPLARLDTDRARWRAFVEKLPFLAAAAFASVATHRAQEQAGAFDPLGHLDLAARVGHAITSYHWYAEKAFWPTELAVFYPHPGVAPGAEVAGPALFGGLVITIAAIALAKRRPWLIVGWLWFLGMLVPMIGLVQVGMQAHADRYAYLPLLGLEIAVAYEAWAWLGRFRAGRVAYVAATAAIALALGASMRAQLAYWRDTETLFRRALAVTTDNYVAYERVAATRLAAGDADEAIRLFGEALRLQPHWPIALDGLARALWVRGQRDEALWNHREAVRLDPANATLSLNLARALLELGWSDEAVRVLRRGVRRGHGARVPELRAVLAHELARRGDLDGARKQAQRAVDADPSLADTKRLLGRLAALDADALQRDRRDAEAVAAYRAALAADPTIPEARNNLAWLLAASHDASVRDPAEALRVAEAAAAASRRRDANVLDTLAVALAANGRFDAAIATLDEARALLSADAVSERNALDERRARFASSQPWIDPAP